MYVFSLAINVAICLSNDVCIYSHYLMHVCKEMCIRTHVTCVFSTCLWCSTTNTWIYMHIANCMCISWSMHAWYRLVMFKL